MAHDDLRLLADCFRAGTSLDNIRAVIKGTEVNINGAVVEGLRPLHYAAYEGRTDGARLLIQNGAFVNAADDLGYTPLHVASKHGHIQLVKLLIDKGAVVDFFNQEEYFKMDRTSKVLADMTVSPLSLAIENDHADVTEVLLQNGADPNHKYFLGHEINLAPIEHQQCLGLLLEHGAEPDALCRSGMTTLMRACKNGHMDAARLLIKHGAKINLQAGPQFERRTALHFACEAGRAELVQHLLESGADNNLKMEYGSSAMELAAVRGHVEVCKLLLDHGADVNDLSSEDASLLQMVCAAGEMQRRHELIQLLLERGANTRYHARFLNSCAPSLHPLVEYLANVDAQPEQRTVLILLRHGAQVNIRVPNFRIRIDDGAGVLAQVQRTHRLAPDVYALLVAASGRFSQKDIKNDASYTLTDELKATLLKEASKPRSLKHQCRLYITSNIDTPNLPDKLNSLPLPPYIMDYLSYCAL